MLALKYPVIFQFSALVFVLLIPSVFLYFQERFSILKALSELLSGNSTIGAADSLLLLLIISLISFDQYSVLDLVYPLHTRSCLPVICSHLLTSRISFGASHLFDFVKWNFLTSSLFFSAPNSAKITIMHIFTTIFIDYQLIPSFVTLPYELFQAIMSQHKVWGMVYQAVHVRCYLLFSKPRYFTTKGNKLLYPCFSLMQ